MMSNDEYSDCGYNDHDDDDDDSDDKLSMVNEWGTAIHADFGQLYLGKQCNVFVV